MGYGLLKTVPLVPFFVLWEAKKLILIRSLIKFFKSKTEDELGKLTLHVQQLIEFPRLCR